MIKREKNDSHLTHIRLLVDPLQMEKLSVNNIIKTASYQSHETSWNIVLDKTTLVSEPIWQSIYNVQPQKAPSWLHKGRRPIEQSIPLSVLSLWDQKHLINSSLHLMISVNFALLGALRSAGGWYASVGIAPRRTSGELTGPLSLNQSDPGATLKSLD